MNKLSDFKDEAAIVVVAELLSPIMTIFTNPKNQELKNEKNAFAMFGGFFKNSPRAMMDIFAILSEEDPATYHCDGIDVAKNIVSLVSDQKLIELFVSQGQTGDAISSASVSENTEE